MIDYLTKLSSVICEASYIIEKQDRNDNFKKLNFDLIYNVSNSNGLNGFHLKKNYSNFLVFRGTEMCRKDIFTDLHFFKTKPFYDKSIKVHTGFYKSYIKDGTHLKIREHCKTLNRLIITGHSLGGAIATLCAYDLIIKYPYLNIKVITFGSPRVGNKNFMKSYNSKHNITHYRYETDLDPIPRFPYIGYYHVGLGIVYDKNTHQYVYKDDKSIFHSWQIKDHYIRTYIDYLTTLVLTL